MSLLASRAHRQTYAFLIGKLQDAHRLHPQAPIASLPQTSVYYSMPPSQKFTIH
ncbi:predicted protein [Sclerotinia sclerotiorum 1980 UF-70]|uniref:Uncharacterized protein n=1 Tax=Sclerotinia sclerotiorum (strain ATCC 18683 / 1980 / Ss-1) TaxID=665079 RepID=A7ENU1_SCLS1|nr:predicted protein [Sclerotinia sclerotiorum 1980 UF-70]EDO04507.1 predicted protein [Sclerotinia sclerotiorum 1980 UF-70]